MTEMTFRRGRFDIPLFKEDFDAPPEPEAAPEPEVIEPVFSASELEAARTEAWRDGHDTAAAEAARGHQAVAQQTLSRIGAELGNARDAAAAIAHETADALARLLFSCFAAAFPAMARGLGEREVQAVIRRVLPLLQDEPVITIRVCPAAAEAIRHDIETLNGDLIGQVRIVPADSVPVGDAQVTWRNGRAVRDTAGIWSEIESILAPAGMLPERAQAREVEHVG